MNTMRSNEATRLPPFPEGWYFVASRDAIRKQQLIQKTWLGEEVVIWCDEQGRICMADAVCPHLGSMLGPEVGACVRDGRLVCPFHGFEFDTSGRCVATPYAPPPNAARLTLYETREILGMVFAWWGMDGRPPQWALPDEPETNADWSRVRFHTKRFRGHPQETTENAVDLAHLRYVHGYHNVHRTEPVLFDGPYMRSCFDFVAKMRIAGILTLSLDTSTVTHVHGLGYSYVEFVQRAFGLRARLWVLSTPISEGQAEVVLAGQAGLLKGAKRPMVALGFLPQSLRLSLLSRIVMALQARYVSEDVVIWERKQYRSRPRLNRADGEILAYRRYCKQFYPGRHQLGRRLIASQA